MLPAGKKERKGNMFKRIQLATLGMAALLSVRSASADLVFNFDRLTDNGNMVDLGSQLFMTVSDSGFEKVTFHFENLIGIDSSITDVYFDDGSLLGIASISSSAGVLFDDPATPGNLPAGNTAIPPFVTTADFSADSDPPVAPNGVDASDEWLDIEFDLLPGKTFSDVAAALALTDPDQDQWLRVGLHMQSINDAGGFGGSDSYINDPVAVPVPAALLMGAIGLPLAGVLGRWVNRRRNREGSRKK